MKVLMAILYSIRNILFVFGGIGILIAIGLGFGYLFEYLELRFKMRGDQVMGIIVTGIAIVIILGYCIAAAIVKAKDQIKSKEKPEEKLKIHFKNYTVK